MFGGKQKSVFFQEKCYRLKNSLQPWLQHLLFPHPKGKNSIRSKNRFNVMRPRQFTRFVWWGRRLVIRTSISCLFVISRTIYNNDCNLFEYNNKKIFYKRFWCRAIMHTDTVRPYRYTAGTGVQIVFILKYIYI